MAPRNPVTIAAVQSTPVLMDRDATVERVVASIKEAGAAGAQLVVLPEAIVPGYPDFAGEVITALKAADAAIFVNEFQDIVSVDNYVKGVIPLESPASTKRTSRLGRRPSRSSPRARFRPRCLRSRLPAPSCRSSPSWVRGRPVAWTGIRGSRMAPWASVRSRSR